jgi:transcription elongation factor Elf1
VDTASELIELFNPAEIYAAFAEAAREAAGGAAEPTATGELLGAAGISVEETVNMDADAGYVGAAEQWAAGRPPVLDADDDESAALALYNLALDFQDRSQQSEASLIDQFEEAASRVVERLGDLIIVDDEDERLVLGSNGRFRAEVLPEDGDGEWRQLQAPDEIVEFYDPTDIFGDLADALAEAFPAIAPELEDDEEDDEEADEGTEDVEDVEDVEDAPDEDKDRR